MIKKNSKRKKGALSYRAITIHMYSFGMILMNKKKFESLPDDTQQILLDASKKPEPISLSCPKVEKRV